MTQILRSVDLGFVAHFFGIVQHQLRSLKLKGLGGNGTYVHLVIVVALFLLGVANGPRVFVYRVDV